MKHVFIILSMQTPSLRQGYRETGGSSFRVERPLSMKHAMSRDPSCDVPVQGATASSALRLQPCALKPPGRILVIDDDRSFVSGLARILRRDGYTVDTADNGTAGLTQMQAHRYDVLLCDL